MGNFVLMYRGCGDAAAAIPYTVLQKIQYFFYFAYACFGVTCTVLHFLDQRHDHQVFIPAAVFAILYISAIKLTPSRMKFIWSLWMHMSVMLLLLSFVLFGVNATAAGPLLILGAVGAAVMFSVPCFGSSIFVTHQPEINGLPPMPADQYEAV